MKTLARSSRGVHLWRTAKALDMTPGEVADCLSHGDPQVHFAYQAEAEDESRTVERWDNLASLIKSGFEAVQKALKKAFG